MIDEVKLIKFLAKEIKEIDELEKKQNETDGKMEIEGVLIKRETYQDLIERIMNDEFVE